jgi:hypothetical protein
MLTEHKLKGALEVCLPPAKMAGQILNQKLQLIF